MNSHPLAGDYFRWLEAQTRDEGTNPGKSYWDLLGIMFDKEFAWTVAHDDNRIADGLELRVEFCYANHIRPDGLKNLMEGAASFLEVLIGLSRRLAFTAGGSAPGWAWQLINNLELHKMTDPLPKRKIDRVHDILDAVIWRTYQPDGGGGLFPLIGPEEDLTKIELWYQMAMYIDELHPEHR